MEAKWDTVLQKRCLSGCQTISEALSMRQPVWCCESVRENTKHLRVSPGLLLILFRSDFHLLWHKYQYSRPCQGTKVPCCYLTRHIHHLMCHIYVLKDEHTLTSLLHACGLVKRVEWLSQSRLCGNVVAYVSYCDSALCNCWTVHCRCMWYCGLFANPWWKTLKVVRHFDGLQFTRLSTWWQVWRMN